METVREFHCICVSWSSRSDLSQIRLVLWTSMVLSLQSCLTLCDPIDGSPPGSSVPGFLQARTLEWVAISFSNAWKRKVKVKSLSRVWLLATPWTAAHQAPLSMGFSRQEYWSGVPLPSPWLNETQPHCGRSSCFTIFFFLFQVGYVPLGRADV